MTTQQVYDPVAPCLTATAAPHRFLEQLSGKVVGFLDNAKPNFNHLVDDLAEILVRDYQVARVVKRRKRSASQGAPEAMLQELADLCDAVITGSGD